jgi:hypothetical protein
VPGSILDKRDLIPKNKKQSGILNLSLQRFIFLSAHTPPPSVAPCPRRMLLPLLVLPALYIAGEPKIQ